MINPSSCKCGTEQTVTEAGCKKTQCKQCKHKSLRVDADKETIKPEAKETIAGAGEDLAAIVHTSTGAKQIVFGAAAIICATLCVF